jgi:hypothetical protein
MNKRFELVRNFGQLWKYKPTLNDEIEEKDLVGYLDPTSVMMVIPKLKSIQKLLEGNFKVDRAKSIPRLDYNIQLIEGNNDKIKVIARLQGGKHGIVENSVRMSKEYMSVMLKMCKETRSQSILFKYKKDSPLWAETNELICIIAPRVGDGA